MRSSSGLLMITVVLAGCGDCGGVGDPDAGQDAGLQPDALCRELARQQCDYFIRCHADPTSPITGVTLTDAGFLNVVPASERDRCEEALAQDLDCRKITASLLGSRATFTESAYRGCLDTAYPAGTCDRNALQALERCRGLPFLAGTVVLGEACSLDEDCAGTGFCSATAPDTCGVCAEPSSVTDSPCTRDVECNPGTHFCTGGDGEAGTCQPFLAVGQRCTINDLQQEECGSGRVCTQVGLGFECDLARLEGEACDLNRFQCARSGRGIFELVCAPVVPPGGGATVDRCVKAQTVAGGSCGNGEGSDLGFPLPLCPESQYCLENLCTDRLGQGAGCPTGDECAFGLRCLTPAGGGSPTCEPYRGVEQACEGDADCQALLGCEGTCQPRLAATTEPCDAFRPCASGTCQAGTCVAAAEDGVTCSANADCLSNVCSGTCQDACWDD